MLCSCFIDSFSSETKKKVSAGFGHCTGACLSRGKRRPGVCLPAWRMKTTFLLVVVYVIVCFLVSSTGAFPYSAAAYLNHQLQVKHRHHDRAAADAATAAAVGVVAEADVIGGVISQLAAISLYNKTKLEPYHHHNHRHYSANNNNNNNMRNEVAPTGSNSKIITQRDGVDVGRSWLNNETELPSSGGLDSGSSSSNGNSSRFTAALTKRFAEMLVHQGSPLSGAGNKVNRYTTTTTHAKGSGDGHGDYGTDEDDILFASSRAAADNNNEEEENNSGDYAEELNALFESSSLSDDNTFGRCLQDLQTIFSLAEHSEHIWARKFLDSWSKPPSGIYAGSLMWFGDFDECLAAQPPNDATTVGWDVAFEPLFCKLGFSTSPQPDRIKPQPSLIQFPVALTLGICVSSRCNASSITEIATLLALPRARLQYPVLKGLQIVPSLSQCQQMNIPLDWKAYLAISFFSFWGLLVVMATVLEIVIEARTPTVTVSASNGVEMGSVAEVEPEGNESGVVMASRVMTESPNMISPVPTLTSEDAANKSSSLSSASSTGSNSPTAGTSRAPSPTPVGSLPSSFSSISVAPAFFSSIIRFIVCFSVYSNFQKMMKTSVTSQGFSENLRCLNGIRVISLLWIVLAHSYFFLQIGFDNLQTVFDLRKSLFHQVILGSVLGVDTFFFLSGFLAYWTLTKTLNLYGRPHHRHCSLWRSLPFVYLSRYIRLTPPYAVMILVSLCLWPYLSNGPFYYQQLDEYCYDNWWTNLLYVNNIVNSTRMCVGWSWYLAVDMQLSLLAPFAVFLYQRYEKLALILTTSLLACQAIIAAVLTMVFNLPSTLLPDMQDVNPTGNGSMLSESFPHSADYMWELTPESSFAHYFDMIYIKPLCWIAPYLVGVTTGFLIAKRARFFARVLSVRVTAFLWIVASITIVLLVFGQWGQYSHIYVAPRFVHAMYNAFSRTVWAVAIGWIVLACVLNKAGIVNRFLSWRGWTIPAKLAYTAYLLHPLVIIFYVQTSRRSFHATDTTMVWFFFGTMCVTYFVSLIFSVLFESPLLSLQRLYVRPCFTNITKQQEQQEQGQQANSDSNRPLSG